MTSDHKREAAAERRRFEKIVNEFVWSVSEIQCSCCKLDIERFWQTVGRDSYGQRVRDSIIDALPTITAVLAGFDPAGDDERG